MNKEKKVQKNSQKQIKIWNDLQQQLNQNQNIRFIKQQAKILQNLQKDKIKNKQQQHNFKSEQFLYRQFKSMYSILNHDPSNNKPQSSHNQIQQTRLPSQSAHTNSTYNQNAKVSMKQLYKNQLDQFMQQKQKQKRMEKQMILKQKQDYREKVRIGQQNQKMKDLAYKNYYKMLMQSHDHNSQTYVSPYQMRDKIKDSHIQNSIQQQMQKSQNYQYQRRMRQLQKKNSYKQQLTRQIQQRKRFQQAKKNYLQQQKNYYRQHNKSPQQIEFYQRQKKKQQMDMYRNDLDKIVHDKMSQSRKNNQYVSDPKLTVSSDHHNPLINPLPYNIQNPYLLKQMQKLSSQNIRNDSHINGQQIMQDRPRNESSYFARQANNVLK